MTKYDIEIYRIKADICRKLADPKRQMMISELRESEKTVGEIAQAIGISQPATSHHLNVLHDGGIVNKRREGSNIYYSLADPRIVEACDIVHSVILHKAKQYREFADKVMA